LFKEGRREIHAMGRGIDDTERGGAAEGASQIELADHAVGNLCFKAEAMCQLVVLHPAPISLEALGHLAVDQADLAGDEHGPVMTDHVAHGGGYMMPCWRSTAVIALRIAWNIRQPRLGMVPPAGGVG